MKETIYKEDAIHAIERMKGMARREKVISKESAIYALKALPSAEPETKPISYMECANAMLKMWLDNVLTDGEYNRIMEKLNSKHMTDMRGEQE